MREKEAKARIKINKLLEDAGWKFEDSADSKANIRLEAGVKFADLGDDFEHQAHGFIDFLLLDKDSRPLVVVEAKKESIDPLMAKEQARNYARNTGARFIILTNGNIHYLWDTQHGNPETITRFPSQDSITQFKTYTPNPQGLAEAEVDDCYIIESQRPDYRNDPKFNNPETQEEYLRANNLKKMRPYQVKAIQALQYNAGQGKQRFLFEMATGTGKTLVSAAVIKLFLKTGNARRVLFLVDRIELEDQAIKAFRKSLGRDYHCVVYKEARDEWQNAQVVVSTIQTFLAGDRYKKEFSPTDFELVISDEAHRSIGGNSRAVFEYFVGFKLGLTATPKDYLKGFDTNEDPNSQREFERRALLSTYKTFGCEAGEPTFRYDLLAGVQDGYLINPVVVDARTEITTQLLSKEGYALHSTEDDDPSTVETFIASDYERKFVNEETNVAMCQALLDNGLRDPIAQELGMELFGKTIVFCVSQRHAARIVQILNKMAMQRWPDVYDKSDFAVQVTSLIPTAQQMTVQFTNNALNGKVPKPDGYESSKTRVTVTVGMMTTGYDCQDLLNLALMRPVYSPSDFVQIKGRGTRKFLFEYNDYTGNDVPSFPKTQYKFFDFFATCEYFEKDFKYDEKIKLPVGQKKQKPTSGGQTGTTQGGDEGGDTGGGENGPIDLQEQDSVKTVVETAIGDQGMRIDREGFRKALKVDIADNQEVQIMWKNGDYQGAEEYVKANVFDRPKFYLNLDKIRKIFHIDRRISIKEVLQMAFGQREGFEMKDDLLESEWSKFMEINPVTQEEYDVAKTFFKAYVVDPDLREIIDHRQFAKLHFSQTFSFEEYEQLDARLKSQIPIYIKDYVSLNTFMK